MGQITKVNYNCDYDYYNIIMITALLNNGLRLFVILNSDYDYTYIFWIMNCVRFLIITV